MIMEKTNTVFIARSLDGYIADREGSLEWLQMIPNPDQTSMGYEDLISRVDALVMGRLTFETVLGFDMDWPYQLPVYVLTTSLEQVPPELEGRVHLLKGPIPEVLKVIHGRGHYRLYIDGGACIRAFLEADLIDEMILTTLPVLLGGGSPLFTTLPGKLEFEHLRSELFLKHIVQDHYRRKRPEPFGPGRV